MIIAALIILLCVSFKPTEAHKKMPLIVDDRTQQNPMNRQGERILHNFRLSI